MASEDFEKKLPSIEEVQKCGLKILVIIVNRSDGDKACQFLKERHYPIQFSFMAEGTRGAEYLDLFGLETMHKTLILCVGPGFQVKETLPEANEALHLHKAGKGIAFTIPLSGLVIPHVSSPKGELMEKLMSSMEDEVDSMNNEIAHSIILTLVDHGYSEDVVKAAKEAGARGGTILHARRTGIEDAVKFFGLTVQAEKEMIAILTHRRNKQEIMDKINASFGIDTDAHGIILSVPVDGIAGANL